MAFEVVSDKKVLRLDGVTKSKVPKTTTTTTSLASMESLSMPLTQEVVVSADIRCEDCQKRIAEVMSRMNETESIVVNVVEKTVTISCKYPNGVKASRRIVPAVYKKNPLNKTALIKRLFRSSYTCVLR